MTIDDEVIGELDLMAYADGLLDADPGRKARVAAHIDEHPQAAEFVHNIEAQNAAIRNRYAALAGRPVPDGILDPLHDAPTSDRGARRPARLAAIAAMLVIAAGLGWAASDVLRTDASATGEFAETAARQHGTDVRPTTAGDGIAATSTPLAFLTQRISLEIEAPELHELGYQLVEKQRVGSKDDPVVRLVYQRADGRRASVFLRTRWQDERTPTRTLNKDGVTVRFWLDGPLAVALAVDEGEKRLTDLAEIVHQSVKRTRLKGDSPREVATPGLGVEKGLAGTGVVAPESTPSLSGTPAGLVPSAQPTTAN